MKSLRFRAKFLEQSSYWFWTQIRVGSTLILEWDVCTATVVDYTSFPVYSRETCLLYFVHDMFLLLLLVLDSLFGKSSLLILNCNSSKLKHCAIMTNNPPRKTLNTVCSTLKQQKLSSKLLESVTRLSLRLAGFIYSYILTRAK